MRSNTTKALLPPPPANQLLQPATDADPEAFLRSVRDSLMREREAVAAADRGDAEVDGLVLGAGGGQGFLRLAGRENLKDGGQPGAALDLAEVGAQAALAFLYFDHGFPAFFG